MSHEEKIARRSALLSFRFLGTAVVGSVLMGLVAAFGTLPAQLAVLGSFVSVVGGLFIAYLDQEGERERRRNAAIENLSVPLALAADPELFKLYRSLCAGLTTVASQPDGIIREAAVQKVASLAEQVADLAAGEVVFSQTEGWRTLYEKLLLSPGLKTYRSVAWVQTREYWQDAPGQQSMRVNFEAVARGVQIERVVILPDSLWPAGELLPDFSLLPWLENQHEHGIRLALVREAEAARESDLILDMGIYGTRAVGVQELDEQSRTLRFTLHIDSQEVRVAEDRWRRLALYAVPFETLRAQAARVK